MVDRFLKGLRRLLGIEDLQEQLKSSVAQLNSGLDQQRQWLTAQIESQKGLLRDQLTRSKEREVEQSRWSKTVSQNLSELVDHQRSISKKIQDQVAGSKDREQKLLQWSKTVSQNLTELEKRLSIPIGPVAGGMGNGETAGERVLGDYIRNALQAGWRASPSAHLFSPLAELTIDDSDDAEAVVFAHRMRFTVPVRQPLLLISQIQRSGGTLMTQLLDGHPQLHVHPSELHIGRPNKYHWPQLDLSLNPKDMFEQLRESPAFTHAVSGYQKLGKSELRSGRKSDILPFIFLGELQAMIFAQILERKPPASQREVLDAYATSYFNAWIDYADLYRPPESVKYWVAFAARFLAEPGRMDQYLADYPDGRVLVPVRDPVSWFASARRHSSEYHDPTQACDLWLHAQEILLRDYERHPDTIMFIEHELLTTETERVMRSVAQFLDINFEPSMLTPTFNKMIIPSDSSFGSKYGVDPTSRDRSNEVEPEIRSQLRERTGAVYEALQRIAASQLAVHQPATPAPAEIAARTEDAAE